MENRIYIKVSNGNETLYFKDGDLTLIDVECFKNDGYKVETILGIIKRITYLNSLERLKVLRGN